MPTLLAEDGNIEKLYITLTDFRFIEGKVLDVGLQELIADYDLPFTHKLLNSGGEDLRLIQDTLRLAASMLDHPRHHGDRSLLRSQLYGRLMSETAPTITVLLNQIQDGPTPWLCPLTPNLTTAGGALQRTIAAHNGKIKAIACTPDGERVVSVGDRDHTAKLWDLRTGEELKQLEWTNDQGVEQMLLSSDGSFVITARNVYEWESDTHDRYDLVTVWEIATETKTERVSFRVASLDFRTKLVLTPDNTRLLIANENDQTITIWDLAAGAVLQTITDVDTLLDIQVVATRTGQRILIERWHTLDIWDLDTGQKLHTLTSPLSMIRAEALSPDGDRAVVGLHNGTLIVWDLTTGAEIATLTGHFGEIKQVQFHPDGQRIISTAHDGTIKVWDLDYWQTRVKLFIQQNARRVLGQNLDFRALTGHTSDVYGIATTPNGHQLVSASDDQTIKVWDLATGQELRTLRGHNTWVRAVAITPNGRWIISGSFDRTLKMWDLATGTLLRTLTGHTHKVCALALTGDGLYAVSGSFDHTLRLWQVHNPGQGKHGKLVGNGHVDTNIPSNGGEMNTPIHTMAHAGQITSVVVSPDGSYAAVAASDDGMVKIWDLERGIALHDLPAHGVGHITALAITQDLHWLVMGAYDHTIRLFQLQSGEQRVLTGHTNQVTALTLTPDGRYIVSGSYDNTLKIWELASGKEVCSLNGHTAGVCGVAVTPNGRHVVSASCDTTIKIWDLRQALALPRRIATQTIRANWHMERDSFNLGSMMEAVWLSPDGCHIVAYLCNHTMQVWNLKEGRAVQTFTGHANDTGALAFMQDGQHIVSGDSDGILKVWSMLHPASPRPTYGHADLVRAIAVTPGGRHAITASNDRTLKVWDTATGSELHTLEGHVKSVDAVTITPDGQWIISASADATLKVWATATGVEQWTLSGHTDDVNAIAVTPDGRSIVSASDDHTLKVWNLATGECVRALNGHTNGVEQVIITPNGQHVISAEMAGKVKVWHLASGRELRTLTDLVEGMALLPNGQALIAGFAEDHTLHMWDIESGERLLTFEGHTEAGSSMVITPNGARVIVSGQGGALHIWNTHSGALENIYEHHATWIFRGLRVTADGQRVVSASGDGTVKLWDVQTGRRIASFGVDGLLMDCAITPDGTTIIVGERTGRVHMLQVRNPPLDWST